MSKMKSPSNFFNRYAKNIGGQWRKPKESEWWGYIEPVSKYQLWKPKPEPILHNAETGWTINSRRVGVLAKKIGMSGDWDEWGQRVPLTFLQIESAQVVSWKTQEKNGFDAVVMGFENSKDKHINKPQQGMFIAQGVPFKRRLSEFKVTPDCFLPIGTRIDCRHFVPGQKVDVQGTSKGKGFQGGMKRWGFSGGRASHGNSLAHRTIGSTGTNTTPGRVRKGKKMPGRLGGETCTVHNLFVFSIVPEYNVITVVGSVPGSKNSYIRISDARIPASHWPKCPPYPTHFSKPGDSMERVFARMPLPSDAKEAIRDGYDVQKVLLDPVYDWDTIEGVPGAGGYNLEIPTDFSNEDF